MKCPFCGIDNNKVVDKRSVIGSGEIRRRRECLKCHVRFTTYERLGDFELIVLKRDGRREQFIKDKLRNGILRALEKQPTIGLVDSVTDRIERKLRTKYQREVASTVIGKLVLMELKKVDKVAYLRFASVYRHFDSPEDFARELTTL